MAAHHANAEFEIVVICTGNRFRSPLVEALLRERLRHLPVRVTSYGTLDLGPLPPLPEAGEAARRLGLDLSAHRARCLQTHVADEVDLVLGFEHAHVVAAVVDMGARREATFTLPELVELTEWLPAPGTDDPLERARRLVELAHAQRVPHEGLPTAPELDDPIGLPESSQREIADRLRDLTARLAAKLFDADGR